MNQSVSAGCNNKEEENVMNNVNDLKAYKTAIDLYKFEGSLSWQIFGIFLVAHAIFVSFLLRSVFTNSGIIYCDSGNFIASIIGFILCIFWLTCRQRNAGYHKFRLAQAKKYEPEEFNIVKGEIEKFGKGKKVKYNDKNLKMSFPANIIKTSFSAGIVIVIFSSFYIFIIIISYPW